MTTKGDRLRALRENAGLTLEEVADYLFITRQAVYKYEKDIVTNIPSDRIEALAKLYHSTPEYIMGWEADSKVTSKKAKPNVDFLAELDDGKKYIIEVMSSLSPKSREELMQFAEFLKSKEESKND